MADETLFQEGRDIVLRPCPLQLADQRYTSTWTVKARKYANREIRAYLTGNVRQPSAKTLKALSAARAAAHNRFLVYKHELQAHSVGVSRFLKVARKTKLTRHGKHILSEAGGVLEADYGREVAFVTLTLPGSSHAAVSCFAMSLRQCQNLFLQYLRDAIRRSRVTSPVGGDEYLYNAEKSNEQPLEWMLVWEFQKRGALHAHMAIGLPDESLWSLMKAPHPESGLPNYHHWWCQVLETVSRKIGVDLFERFNGDTWRHNWKGVRVEMEKVKKSVGRYLSKYLSKSAPAVDGETVFYPPRWWSVSNGLRSKLMERREFDEVKHATYTDGAGMVSELGEIMATDANGFFAMKHPVSGEIIGYVAYFAPESLESSWRALRDVLRCGDAAVDCGGGAP